MYQSYMWTVINNSPDARLLIIQGVVIKGLEPNGSHFFISMTTGKCLVNDVINRPAPQSGYDLTASPHVRMRVEQRHKQI